jgi:hypothetical protein
MPNASENEYYDEYNEICEYFGTDFLEVKIYLICLFALLVAICSLLFNTFFVIVFLLNPSLRHSPLYYFGVLAVMDAILAVNYILLMVVPVIMDYFHYLWLYHIFLGYVRPMMTLSFVAMFCSILLIIMATVERLLRTFNAAKFGSMRR